MTSESTDFVILKKGNDSRSVWFHFLIHVTEPEAKCKECGALISCKGGLHTHVKKKHNINLLKRQTESSSNEQNDCLPKKAAAKITNYLKAKNSDSLDEVLARMIALDGLTFNVISTSDEIRAGLRARNFVVPSDPKTIKFTVINYGKKLRNTVTVDLNKLKAEGKQFSLTFDEWTPEIDDI